MSPMKHTIELGLDTFGDATVDAEGKPLSQAQAIRDVVKQGELADQVRLAFIGVGEHHRPDFSVSAPEVVLAAIANSRSAPIRPVMSPPPTNRRKKNFGRSTGRS